MLDFVQQNLPLYLQGAWTTLQLALFSCSIGFVFAVPLALMRLSQNRMLFALSTAYVFFFRGTPLLAQIFLIYYGSGQFRPALDSVGLWQFFREPMFCALLSLTLNTVAYTSEILRGAIQSIPKGEIEAAKALGLQFRARLRLIVLPRALRLSWPAYTNEVVYQIQATSLVSIITVMDITGVARKIGSRDLSFYESFSLAALFYLIIVYGFILVAKRIEVRLNRYHTFDAPKRAIAPMGLMK